MVKVLGVDPGLAATGAGLISGNGNRVTGYRCKTIVTKKQTPLPKRLEQIYTGICSILEEQSPDLLVVEDVFTLPRQPKSGLQLGKVSGVVILAGQLLGIPVWEIPNREVKKVLTGNGNADKTQLERCVREMVGEKDAIRPSHASDALALAITAMFRLASHTRCS